MRHILIGLLAVLPLTAIAAAQAPEPASDDRFQIERQGDAFIRLDRRSGAISTCTLEGGQFDCRMSADERAALQAEIDRLAEEVEHLRTAEAEPKAGISKNGKEIKLKLPSDEEIKGVVAYLQGMLDRAIAALKDLAGSV